MLTPPLSTLSTELLVLIVDHVEQIASTEGLKALSLADRAFTPLCQERLVKQLSLSGKPVSTKKQLANAYELLSHKPSLINFVQSIQLSLLWHTDGSWLFNNGTFTRIILLLSQSANPPSRLCIDGMQNYGSQHPDMLVGKMIRTFFASSLVVLHLFHCTDVPPPILLVCPNLKELTLVRVSRINTVTEEGMDYFERPSPSLETLTSYEGFDILSLFTDSPRLPPLPRPLVDITRLRTFTNTPRTGEEIGFFSKILDAARDSLEDLTITYPLLLEAEDDYQPLPSFLNLSTLSRLHTFKLNTRITEDDPSRSLNVDELRIVLDAIPLPNQLTTLDLDIGVYGASPFHSTRSQDWRGLMKAIRRLSQPIDVGTRSLSSLSSPSGSSSSSSSSKVKLTFNFSFSTQSTPGFHISQSQHEDLVEFVRGEIQVESELDSETSSGNVIVNFTSAKDPHEPCDCRECAGSSSEGWTTEESDADNEEVAT
ncbi:hypothetical protein CC1G_08436 [Coprinopsis cinerea okayama7|uniref:F-box domain-containing protein n=1 Tax=Coprinopsis cinerea (strain Okayama-7 / 130 / ATCC MYA-4618 / FGSC 9003) TaxID=240176 RepID=A8NAR7_COPC7|nr:hypothetical protein CC1G_08436 [Coprinopsis cinerea okayama7\|eukprot:XP_001831919.1 hypothetical protein CC1G_08436 [Coprinopsis cinerea okayama7\